MAHRGIAQLTRVDIGYSLHAGASKGVREFVASPLMGKFQKAHPHVQLNTAVNDRGLPHVEATYCQSRMDSGENTRWNIAAAAHASLGADSACPLCVRMAAVNSNWHHVSLRHAQDAAAVLSALETLAQQTGRPLKTLSKWAFPQTRASSVQGRWDAAFTLKPLEQQLAPLLKQQTHLVGLAPTEDAIKAAAAAPAAAAVRAVAAKK